MDERNQTSPPPPDPHDYVRASEKLARQSIKVAGKTFLRKLELPEHDGFDPLGLGSAFLALSARLAADPLKVATMQASLWRDYVSLSQRMYWRMLGVELDPVISPERGDRRFADDAWDDNVVFDMIRQGYLLTARRLLETVKDVEGLDEQTSKKVEFYIRQSIDGLAPSNFAITNPAVLRETLKTGGKNLLDGLSNFLRDLEEGDGCLSISMTDVDAFEVGQNLALTPGKVIFQNDLIQLIQYAPTTPQVFSTPLLIVPPWINKYYIMDLTPENSMVRWLVDQGHTVFMISWVNPDARLAHKRFDDYMLEGPLAALDAIEKAIGAKAVNAVGYCMGGILLAGAVAYLTAKDDQRIKSATYLATMLDFSDVGDISVFIDEEQIESLEHRINSQGYLDGRSMATTFRMLRANDLIWSFFVNNYLLGKDPVPFDLLYWNCDSTRMPAAMHSFFLRNMYQRNRLKEPNGITLDGQSIDLTKVKVPSYVLSAVDDHIALWKTAYATTQLFSGPVKFVLSASGHIAGVINPPAKGKYLYWVRSRNPAKPEEWFKGATPHRGSWWPDWNGWLKRYAGKKVSARAPGKGKLKPIEDAPGSYVKVKAIS